MVTTIAVILFISKLCQLTVAVLDPNLVNPPTIGPYNLLSTSSSALRFAQPGNDNDRPDSFLQNRHILRDKRNVKRGEKNFVRLGRDGEEFSRYIRAEKNLIRFGRNENSKGNGFIRLGRSEKGLIRFGRNDNSDDMRFGRRGDKFIRFGRNNGGVDGVQPKDSFVLANSLSGNDNPFQAPRSNRPARTDKFIRFGRGDNGFIRFGKRDNDFDSDEKADNDLVDDDSNPTPMQLYYMLRKNNDLPIVDADLESNASSSTPLDDDDLMNAKLNSLKNNLL